MPTKLYNDIYAFVSTIPKGKVATYGDVSKVVCGDLKCSRVVGYALHKNPLPGSAKGCVPCHRVVFSDGSLASSFAFGGPDEQRKLLEKEKVTFTEYGKVDMTKYRLK
ncbi:MAG: MGMT family protein [Candidatus Woesearchaeota archaeon]|jgi:methylated-DNA-protein-cysteine methyltransferase-like protein